jgi:hypothetical protein
MPYLKLDLLILVVAVLWLWWGIRVVQRVPLIHDPMVAFSRYHPRVAPLVLFLLVIFWPVSKWVWKFVFFVVQEVNNLKQGKAK